MKLKEKRALRVAYVIFAYPTLHKTYVDREIMILQEMGVEVQIYSLHRERMKLSAYQQELSKTVVYINEDEQGTGRMANLQVFLRRPWKYLTTFLHIMSWPFPNFKARYTVARHFLQGIALTRLLMDNPPDHIYAHFLNKSATEALVASRMTGIPYSVEVHASAELFVKPVHIPQKLRLARFIATCTRYNKDYLGKLDSRLEAKSHVIYHGLDANKYCRNRPPRTDRPLILSVGQLMERKGYTVLVEACALLKTRGVNFECRIIGEGMQRPQLEQQIERLGLQGWVNLAGAQDQEEVIRLYEQATAATLPVIQAHNGDRDGIPNALLEAMSMEVPVVSTAHLAMPEVIEDGVNGLLVPPNDPQALADALQRLIEDPALHDRLAQAGRRTVVEQFNPERNARKLLEAFTQ